MHFVLCTVCVIYIQVEEIELKPNGADIDVTEENKKEYIKSVNHTHTHTHTHQSWVQALSLVL